MLSEEEYFAKKDIERRRRLALEQKKGLEAEERERLREQHWFRCAKCGMKMETIVFRGVEIERCFSCGGTYLDEGELEKLAGEESTVLESIVGLFRGEKAKAGDEPKSD